MLDKLTVDHFAPAVGEAFTLDAGEAGSLELELLSARTYSADAPAQDDSGTRTPFSIQFRGPAEPILPQRIYRVEHGSVGALEIFLVPLGVDAAGTRYEAIFA